MTAELGIRDEAVLDHRRDDMRTKEMLGAMTLLLCTALPAGAQQPGTPPATQEQVGPVDDPAARPAWRHEGWGGQARGHGGGWHRHGGWYGQRPLISIALRHRQELGLTSAQVQGLDKLRTDFQRDAIRRTADRRLAELDLRTLLRPDPTDPTKAVDMAKVDAKVHEIERLRADLQISRIRAIEQGKALLTPDQRSKLAALLEQHGPPATGMRPAPGPQQ